jgi:hypothetical protein
MASPTPFSLRYISAGVDVPVAHVQGLLDHVGRLSRVDLEHPEAELWDGLAVVQGKVGDLGHLLTSSPSQS